MIVGQKADGFRLSQKPAHFERGVGGTLAERSSAAHAPSGGVVPPLQGGDAVVLSQPLPFPDVLQVRIRNWVWALPPVAQRLAEFAALFAMTCVPYLCLTRTWVLAGEFLLRPLGLTPAWWPALVATPAIPGRLVAFQALVLVAYWLPGAARWPVFAAGALGIGFALRFIEPVPVALFALVCVAMYALFRTRLPRWLMLTVVVLVPLALRYTGHAMAWQTLDRSATSLGLMVLLWYACYEVTTGRLFSLGRYAGYMQTRLFMEGPILAPEDVRDIEPAGIDVIRWQGVKALVVALAARSLSFHIEQWLGPDWRSTAGPALLFNSYLNYLAISFGIVFGYNMALGILRLAGLPVRDNFQGWFWARTPNEHWRRWNVLFREWIITFTFYPLMRARKGLFASIMLTLGASGLLHLYGMAFGGPIGVTQAGLIVSYWLVNGLAIYAVVAVPRRIPALVARLRFAESPVWSVAGWLATSVFYAVLFFVHHECDSLVEVAGYFGRLFGGSL